MKARDYWTGVTAGLVLAVTFGEVAFWHEQTYSAWWRWLLGLEPKHWRAQLLVPVFTLLVATFLPHILIKFLWVQSNKESKEVGHEDPTR